MIEEYIEPGLMKNRAGESSVSRDATKEVEQETKFLAALPTIQKILRRRTAAPLRRDKSDLFQTIALRLWGWRGKYPDKSSQMSDADWASFAARSAFNEINTQLIRQQTVEQLDAHTDVVCERELAGNSIVEVQSLGSAIWQRICNLTVRQRRALLLHSDELIVNLVQSNVASESAIAELLEFDFAAWTEVGSRLPLTDLEIADLQMPQKDERQPRAADTAKSIKKARYEARVKLKGLLNR